jgi:glutamine synthetase
LTQAVAFRFGHRASFTPLPEPNGTSNGTHIHWSFLGDDDQPVLHDERQPRYLSTLGSQFIAGVLHHLPALCAVTAPSVPSYYRMRPNRFAPMQSDVGNLDRGSAVRICPAAGHDPGQRARQFNIEFRVADATASPYLALAMLVQAGLDGIRQRRDLEGHVPQPLPDSLGKALTLLEASAAAEEWLGPELLPAYVAFKRAEIKGLDNLDESEICRRYEQVY